MVKHLILKRSKNKTLYPGIWQVVTGTIEKGETAIESTIREAEEETGLKIYNIMYKIPYIGSFYDVNTNRIQQVPTFGVVFSKTPDIRLSEEHIEYEWKIASEAKMHLVIPDHNNGLDVFEKYIINNSKKEIYKI